MLIEALFITAGLAALIAGAEALVRGASGIALAARMSPAVVALTVVAAGTSMPELVVSAGAAVSGNPGLALGNVVGSNLLNIGLVLGLTALVRPLRILRNTLRFEWPVAMIAAVQFFLLARDGRIDRLEGVFLVGSLAAFMTYAVALDRRGMVEAAPADPPATASFGRTGTAAAALNGLAVLIGCGLLAVGARALVKGASDLAAGLGVSETVIGLTIVAVGTSAPELVTSMVAVLRGRDDMAVGNVIGSSIFNLLGILGVAALARPIPVPDEMIARDAYWLLGMTAVLFPMMTSRKNIARIEGAVLIAGYTVYTVLLILGA